MAGKTDKRWANKNPLFNVGEMAQKRAPQLRTGHGGGKPRKIFDDEDARMVREMAAIFCTQEDIARVIGVNVMSMKQSDKLMDAFYIGRMEGRTQLRSAQAQAALKGNNTAMMIWLGKQHLQQSDNPLPEGLDAEESLDQRAKLAESIGKIIGGSSEAVSNRANGRNQ